jgi:hypothetical protein
MPKHLGRNAAKIVEKIDKIAARIVEMTAAMRGKTAITPVYAKGQKMQEQDAVQTLKQKAIIEEAEEKTINAINKLIARDFFKATTRATTETSAITAIAADTNK